MAIGQPSNPRLVHRVTLPLPHLPAKLEGLRIAHVTDLHVRRPRSRFDRVARALSALKLDLVFFTGDYVNQPGDEPAGLEVMRRLCQGLRPRLGSFGVFGNHDPTHLRHTFAALPVRWLDDAVVQLEGEPIDLIGLDASRSRRPDSVAVLEKLAPRNGRHGNGDGHADGDGGDGRTRLMLSHYPTYLPIAADLGVDVVFSGHTHGGQWRLARQVVPYNSCDLPMRLSAGLLRHRDTLCAVSRGLGETFLPLRVLCPPQLPVYTLRRGPLPGKPTHHVENVLPW